MRGRDKCSSLFVKGVTGTKKFYKILPLLKDVTLIEYCVHKSILNLVLDVNTLNCCRINC